MNLAHFPRDLYLLLNVPFVEKEKLEPVYARWSTRRSSASPYSFRDKERKRWELHRGSVKSDRVILHKIFPRRPQLEVQHTDSPSIFLLGDNHSISYNPSDRERRSAFPSLFL